MQDQKNVSAGSKILRHAFVSGFSRLNPRETLVRTISRFLQGAAWSVEDESQKPASSKVGEDLSDEETDDEAEIRRASDSDARDNPQARLRKAQTADDACTVFSMLIRLVRMEALELADLRQGLKLFGQISTTFDHIVKAATELIRQSIPSDRKKLEIGQLIQETLVDVSDT